MLDLLHKGMQGPHGVCTLYVYEVSHRGWFIKDNDPIMKPESRSVKYFFVQYNQIDGYIFCTEP